MLVRGDGEAHPGCGQALRRLVRRVSGMGGLDCLKVCNGFHLASTCVFSGVHSSPVLCSG